MNKRGQIDFNILSGTLLSIGFFILAAVLVMLLVFTLVNANLFGDAPTVLHTVTNESGAYINTTGYTLGDVNASNSAYSITAVWANVTENIPVLLLSGNYTVSSAGVITNVSIPINATQWDNSNVSYTYVETLAASSGQLATGNLSSNVSGGISVIGSKFPTVFTIIAIIFVLGLIAVLWFIYQKLKIGGSSFG